MAASKSPRERLFHVRDEIEDVAAVIKGLSFTQYQESYLHRRAVERAAQIVWRSIIGIGNVLRHEYQKPDDRQLWEIATVHLPALGPSCGE